MLTILLNPIRIRVPKNPDTHSGVWIFCIEGLFAPMEESFDAGKHLIGMRMHSKTLDYP